MVDWMFALTVASNACMIGVAAVAHYREWNRNAWSILELESRDWEAAKNYQQELEQRLWSDRGFGR